MKPKHGTTREENQQKQRDAENGPPKPGFPATDDPSKVPERPEGMSSEEYEKAVNEIYRH